jgi:hypothetical protein
MDLPHATLTDSRPPALTRYPHIPGAEAISYKILPPLSSTGHLPASLTSPAFPVPGAKNIFAFWHSGIQELPPYLLRNVINWYRRYAPLGWTIYVLDVVPDSLLNVSRFIDTSSTAVVPAAFVNRNNDGMYAAQHTSDLTRFPLLLKYGGIYLDVGVLQFADLDHLWTTTVSNPDSPFDFAGFTMGSPPDINIVNFAFMCGVNNPLVQRAHRILLNLWEGRTNTTGMHKNPLVSHIPLMSVPQEVVIEEEGQEKVVINDAAMTDYAIQIQCMGAAQHWLDKNHHWDGPRYVREKCWLQNMMDTCFVQEQTTAWNGQRQFDLLRQRLPAPGEQETDDQRTARTMVEDTVARSWCMKLGHGFSAKLFGGPTVGMLWREHIGTDCEEGTYAGWLRWAELCCTQSRAWMPMEIPIYLPTKIASVY